MSDSAYPSEQITRDSLEDAFRGLQSDVDRVAPSVLTKAVYTACGLAVVLIVVSYLTGKRAGRKRSTIVEVRRI